MLARAVTHALVGLEPRRVEVEAHVRELAAPAFAATPFAPQPLGGPYTPETALAPPSTIYESPAYYGYYGGYYPYYGGRYYRYRYGY